MSARDLFVSESEHTRQFRGRGIDRFFSNNVPNSPDEFQLMHVSLLIDNVGPEKWKQRGNYLHLSVLYPLEDSIYMNVLRYKKRVKFDDDDIICRRQDEDDCYEMRLFAPDRNCIVIVLKKGLSPYMWNSSLKLKGNRTVMYTQRMLFYIGLISLMKFLALSKLSTNQK